MICNIHAVSLTHVASCQRHEENSPRKFPSSRSEKLTGKRSNLQTPWRYAVTSTSNYLVRHSEFEIIGSLPEFCRANAIQPAILMLTCSYVGPFRPRSPFCCAFGIWRENAPFWTQFQSLVAIVALRDEQSSANSSSTRLHLRSNIYVNGLHSAKSRKRFDSSKIRPTTVCCAHRRQR